MARGRPTKTKRTLFGERLTAARLEAGLTQTDIARKFHVLQQTVAKWERNNVALRPDQLVTLADLLNVSTDYLLGRTTKKR